MSLWSWSLDEPKGKCPKCEKALCDRKEHLVLYRGNIYHLDCLLDQLTEHIAATAALPWG